MHAIGIRPHLLGDSVMAEPITRYLKTICGADYFNWVIAAKCSQGAPLYIGHPAIDRILISKGESYEGLEEIVEQCDVVFNPLPQHKEPDWPNYRDIYQETWMLAGLPLDERNEMEPQDRVPYLVPWFRIERRSKSIAIWPGARQGEKENRRNPTYEFWKSLSEELVKLGYTIYQCGHPNDFKDYPTFGIDVRSMSFMDAIAFSLGCDLVVGTDSGSMVALAAYHSVPTLSLLSPHWPGHVQNLFAFGPQGKRHVNLWAASNKDHDVNKTVIRIQEVIS